MYSFNVLPSILTTDMTHERVIGYFICCIFARAFASAELQLRTPANRESHMFNESAAWPTNATPPRPLSPASFRSTPEVFHRRELRDKHLRQWRLEPVQIFILHSGLQAALELSSYWRRHVICVVIDSQSELNGKRIGSFASLLDFRGITTLAVEDNTNVTALIAAHSENQWNFIFICSNANTDRLINAVNNLRLFTTKHTWMIVANQVPKTLDGITMSIDSQITALLTDPLTVDSDISRAELVKAFDVFPNVLSGNLGWLQFADWHIFRRLFILEDFAPGDIGTKLRGRSIRNMAFSHLPYSVVQKKNGVTTFSGFNVDVVNALLTYFEANIVSTEIEFGWGQLLNNTFIGLVGYMYRRECDISYTVMYVTTQRKLAVRFFGTLSKCQMDIMYATPPAFVPPTTYLLPFQTEVWLVTGAATLLIVGLLGVVMFYSPGWIYNESEVVEAHTRKFRFWTGTFFQEALEDPSGITARIIYATFVVAVLMIFTYYNSLLTSFLAYQQQQVPIRSLQDLVDRKDYYPLLVNRSSQLEVIRSAKDGVFRALWRKTAKYADMCITKTAAVAASVFYSKKFALISDSTSVVAYLDPCSMFIIPTGYLKDMYYIGARLDFPFNRIMYKSLLRLHEGGVIKRFKKRYLQDSKDICTTEMTIDSFGFEQTVGLFVLLGVGFAIAFVAQWVERIYHRHRTAEELLTSKPLTRLHESE